MTWQSFKSQGPRFESAYRTIVSNQEYTKDILKEKKRKQSVRGIEAELKLHKKEKPWIMLF